MNVGIVFKNLDSNEILYERHPNRLFVPASTIKLFTAYGALHYLGADYKFKTILSSDNKNVKEGVLSSNLYIKFNGDPSLTKSNIEEMKIYKKKSISFINIESIKALTPLPNNPQRQINNLAIACEIQVPDKLITPKKEIINTIDILKWTISGK